MREQTPDARSAALRVQAMALGWGEKTMLQPAFRAMMAL